MLQIDGSHSEGGGQIFRTALALSLLTRRPFRIHNIRHRRPVPGLKRQHLCCIEALKQLNGIDAENAAVGAEWVICRPGKTLGGSVDLDIGTAGSITLLMQSLLLPGLFADGAVRIRIVGGTDTRWSIPMDYFRHLILPVYSLFADIEVHEMRRGYYPKGGGCLSMTISPRLRRRDFDGFDVFVDAVRRQFPAISRTRPAMPVSVGGISAASAVLKNARVAERQADSAAGILRGRCPVRITSEYSRSPSAGSVITLWAVERTGPSFLGADALGEKGKPAEAVGAAAARRLLDLLQSRVPMDHHLADNLIPLMALTGGTSISDRITGHIFSTIYVCEQFFRTRFEVDRDINRISVR